MTNKQITILLITIIIIYLMLLGFRDTMASEGTFQHLIDILK